MSTLAEESYGSSSGTRRTQSSRNSSDKRRAHDAREADREEEEVSSPNKTKGGSELGGRDAGGMAQRNPFKDDVQRKRKPGAGTPDLNLPALEAPQVPSGFVHDKIAQLGSTSSQSEDASEVQKKQKTISTQRARSAAVTGSDPRRAQ
jgi:hypothetical protein